jgi:hypothetical protein
MTPVTLDQLFAPRAIDDFIRDSWGQRFDYVPGWEGKFGDLLEWSAVNRLLLEHSFEPMRIGVVKEGKQLARTEYIQDGMPFPHVQPDALTKHLRDGATLVLNGIDQMHEPIAQLVSALKRALGEPMGVNMYAGWRTTKGFDVHWDEHDVLVLQVSGRKQWHIYGASRPHPLAHALESKFAPPTEVVWEGVIGEGDLLHIPRGWWHVAVPLDEPSLHLTFGIETRNGRHLLQWLIDDLCAGSEWTRKNLPRFATPGAREEHLAHVRDDLLARWTPDLLDRYYAYLQTKMPARHPTSLPWSAMPDGLPASDAYLVQLMSAFDTKLSPLADQQRVELIANGRRWGFAASASGIIEKLLEGPAVSIAELCATVADQVDRDTVRRLVAKLVAQGLVVILGPATAEAAARTIDLASPAPTRAAPAAPAAPPPAVALASAAAPARALEAQP